MPLLTVLCLYRDEPYTGHLSVGDSVFMRWCIHATVCSSYCARFEVLVVIILILAWVDLPCILVDIY